MVLAFKVQKVFDATENVTWFMALAILGLVNASR